MSLVLGLPTCDPLYTALITQDMFLAASFIMILSILTVIGTLLSDLYGLDSYPHPVWRPPVAWLKRPRRRQGWVTGSRP